VSRAKASEEPKEIVPYAPPPEPPAELEIPPVWQLSEKGRQAISVASAQANTQHGIYANVPLVCKQDCPYATICYAWQNGQVEPGDRCPMEIGAILQAHRAYCAELGVDPESIVDLGLIKDLIDTEVIIERCNKILAIEGEVIKQVIVAVDSEGRPLRRPEVHKALDIKEKMQRRKNEILNLLHATRSAKAKTEKLGALDPSSQASQLRELFERMYTVNTTYDADQDVHVPNNPDNLEDNEGKDEAT
jgi:hypothetical protein